MAEPVTLIHTEAPSWALSGDRVPVFSVVRPNPEFVEWANSDREDDEVSPYEPTVTKTFTMPAKTNPGLALDYLRKARENADVAASWLLELAIGTEGYDALVEELSSMDDPDEASVLMQNIIVTVAKRALGGLGKA